jgi:hypothetical protein
MGVHGDYLDGILHKDDLDSILNGNIEKSFKSTIEFLKENGISIDKKPKLEIIESPPRVIYKLIKSYISGEPIPSTVDIALIFKMIWEYRRIWGLYIQPLETVYIIKKPLKETTFRLSNSLYENRIIGNGYSIIGIILSKYSRTIFPAYINWGDDIKNTAAKITADIIMGYVLSRAFISEDELVASASGYLIYIYKNDELYNNPIAHKIIKGNIKQCKEYVEKEKKLDSRDLGGCLASIIKYKNNKNERSSKVNIKDIIEEIKYLSEEDIINEIKSYKI